MKKLFLFFRSPQANEIVGEIIKARPGLVQRHTAVHRGGQMYFADLWVDPSTESTPATGPKRPRVTKPKGMQSTPQTSAPATPSLFDHLGMETPAQRGMVAKQQQTSPRPTAPTPAPVGRAPWQMTKDEFHDHKKQTASQRGMMPPDNGMLDRWHRSAIDDAVKQGHQVPDHVLKEYPDVKAKEPTVKIGEMAVNLGDGRVTRGERDGREVPMATEDKRQHESSEPTGDEISIEDAHHYEEQGGHKKRMRGKRAEELTGTSSARKENNAQPDLFSALQDLGESLHGDSVRQLEKPSQKSATIQEENDHERDTGKQSTPADTQSGDGTLGGLFSGADDQRPEEDRPGTLRSDEPRRQPEQRSGEIRADGAAAVHQPDSSGPATARSPQGSAAGLPPLSAYEYGRRAYHAGLGAAPALDTEFHATLTPEVGSNVERLKEWQRGWTSANLADDSKLAAEPAAEPAETKATPRGLTPETFDTSANAEDYRLSDEQQIGSGGLVQKAEDNFAAIDLLKNLEAEGRRPTEAEKAILARYVGWGAFGQAFQPKFQSYQRYETAEQIPAYAKITWSKADNKHFELFKKIVSRMTPEEYQAAWRSTQNAHYTAEPVVRKMWDAARRLGFKGGRVLEPASGVGNFFGFQPDDLVKKSRRVGVELDSLTGRIAQYLYPGALVQVKGFQEATLADNSFDLAISNVPFGDIKVFDPQFQDDGRGWLGRKVHNYFFAKALDKVRPGGVVAFVTSTGTLDAPGNQKVRDYLAEHSDLLGAVRLPNNAFMENAGTQVTTDLIFLRKKDPVADAEFEALHPRDAQGRFIKKWTDTKPMKVKDEDGLEHEIHVNEYFHDHPEMLLGEMGVGHGYGLYSAQSSGMKGDGRDIEEALSEALQRLPEGALTPATNLAEIRAREEAKLAADHHKLNAFVIDDGKIHINQNGELVAQTFESDKEKNRVLGLTHLREAATKLVSLEVQDTPDNELEEARQALNTAYDDFVARYGNLHARANVQAFAGDPDAGLLLALENDSEQTVLGKTKTVYGKADIFHQRVQTPLRRVERADTPSDALGVVLNETGRLDWPRLAELLDRDAEDVRDELSGLGLIYRDPMQVEDGETQGWITSQEYLSGNVREKLKVAQEWASRPAAHSFPTATQNVEALKAVQPPELMPNDIDVSLGANWIQPQMYTDFLAHLHDIEYSEEPIYGYNAALDRWTMNKQGVSGKYSVANTKTWGTNKAGADELLLLALNQKEPEFSVKDEKGKYVPDRQATAAAMDKLQKLRDEWERWWRADPNRAMSVADIYNERYNTTVLREYDGAHLTFPGMAPHIAERMYSHQKDAVWRGVQEGVALFDHCVGAGKTQECVATAMELRRLGLAKKPMILVPNHNIPQWHEDIKEFYPGARVLTVWKKDWDPAKRREMTNKIATGDYDIIVMSHSAFNMIPASKEQYEEFFGAQLDQISEALEELGVDPDVEVESLKGRDEETRTAKELARARDNLETTLRQKIHSLEKNSDKTLNWEQLGVDALLTDEWDMSYKNLFYASKMGSVSGLSRANSDRAMGYYIKSQHILKKNGGRGVYLATATPISNTMAEMFNIKRTLMPKKLKELGIESFDNWKAMFGEVQTTLEAAPEGGYRPRKRFSKFINLPELIKLYRSVADVKTVEDMPHLQARLPELHGGEPITNVAKPTRYLAAYMKHIQERAEAIQEGKVDPKDDNFLKLTVDARKASLDLSLVLDDAPESRNSKVNQCVRNVTRLYSDSHERKGTQLIFLDMSTPKSDEGAKAKAKAAEDDETPDNQSDDETAEELEANKSVYQKIKERLIASGIPEHEVAFAHDFDTDKKKAERDRKMNSGELRVLIGSTGKMGAGLNIQSRLFAAHHMDCPWRPRDLEQRDGRIIRQGNLHKQWDIPVQVHRYVTKGSFDEYMWQGIVKKSSFISQAKRGQLLDRRLEDQDTMQLTASQVQAHASGNPLLRKKVETEAQLQRLKSLRDDHERNAHDSIKRIREIPGQVAAAQAEIEKRRELATHMDQAAAHYTEHRPGEKDPWRIAIDGKNHDKRDKAGEALIGAHRSLWRDLEPGESKPIAEYHGFTVEAMRDPDPQAGSAFYALVKDPAGKTVGTVDQAASPPAQIQKLDNVLRQLSGKAVQHRDRVHGLTQQIEKLNRERPQLEADANKPFEHAEEYEELLKDLAKTEKRLAAGDTSEDGSAAGEDFDDDMMDETDYGRPGLSKSLQALLQQYRGARRLVLPRSTPEPGPGHRLMRVIKETLGMS